MDLVMDSALLEDQERIAMSEHDHDVCLVNLQEPQK